MISTPPGVRFAACMKASGDMARMSPSKSRGGAAGAFYEVMAVCRGSIVVVLKCGNDLYTQIAGGKTEPPRTAEEVDRFGGRMFGRVLLHAMGMCGLL